MRVFYSRQVWIHRQVGISPIAEFKICHEIVFFTFQRCALASLKDFEVFPIFNVVNISLGNTTWAGAWVCVYACSTCKSGTWAFFLPVKCGYTASGDIHILTVKNMCPRLIPKTCMRVCVFVTKLVIAISQGRNGRRFSYLVCGFIMLRGRTLLFLVEVKGHLRSPEVKVVNPCNRDISR